MSPVTPALRRERAPATSLLGEPLLRLLDVRLGYDTPAGFHLAVEAISFDVWPRERIVVIGPSGCGKSTLLKAIAGFVEPIAGTIELAGNRSLTPGPDRALVFQEFDQLFPWRTVLDNVAYPLRVNGYKRADAAARAHEFLTLTHLDRSAHRHPHELSGGMKQRVAIARALALEPQMLLMDEPFGALDAITRQRLQAELNRIVEQTEVTLFFVTHSIEEALVIGDRVVVLGEAPSHVVEVVDVRQLGGPETSEYSEMRGRLRSLLAVDREESGDGDLGLD
ncbi:MAG TPA: ABC transporter ATP-binding protein [Gaiellaceae bacterium]